MEKNSRQLQRLWEDKRGDNNWIVVTVEGLQAESLQKKPCKTNQSVVERHFRKHSSLMMSSIFRYRFFVAVSVSLGGEGLVVDVDLSSHEQKIYPTTSLDENCIKIEHQTDRNCYVDFRQTYLALKHKFIKGRGYETYTNKESEKSTKNNISGSEKSGGRGGARGPSCSRFS